MESVLKESGIIKGNNNNNSFYQCDLFKLALLNQETYSHLIRKKKKKTFTHFLGEGCGGWGLGSYINNYLKTLIIHKHR